VAIVVEERRKVKKSARTFPIRQRPEREAAAMAARSADPGGGRRTMETVSGMVVDLVEIGERGRGINS
jgi:hypothetical protein